MITTATASPAACAVFPAWNGVRCRILHPGLEGRVYLATMGRGATKGGARADIFAPRGVEFEIGGLEVRVWSDERGLPRYSIARGGVTVVNEDGEDINALYERSGFKTDYEREKRVSFTYKAGMTSGRFHEALGAAEVAFSAARVLVDMRDCLN